MNSKKYLVVFDSNVLNVKHDKKGDFTSFYFNGTFSNVIDRIEALDIYQWVYVAVPIVVWEEMKEQKIEAYISKLELIKDKARKFTFPFCRLVDDLDNDFSYDSYICQRIAEYKDTLSSRQVNIINLNLPSERKYPRIVERAIKKKPPFEGRDNNSDKGFKDTLLWESILEFVENNSEFNILFYTCDKIFNEELKFEFKALYPDVHIEIFKKEDEASLIKQLEIVAKELDATAHIPKDEHEYQFIMDWVESEDFKSQFVDWTHLFDVINKFISYSDINVLEIEDISIDDSEVGVIESFSASILAEIVFNFRQSSQIKDNYDIRIIVSVIDESSLVLEDVFIEAE